MSTDNVRPDPGILSAKEVAPANGPTTGETGGSKRSRRRRLVLPIAFLIVGLLIGIAITSVSVGVWVTPAIVLTGSEPGNVSESSDCNGWPQVSYDGYFQCIVSITCKSLVGGPFSIYNVSAPQASNVRETPALPMFLQCGDYQNDTLHISGQLGYSGSVNVDVDIE